MPRATLSKEGSILAYFRTAPLEVATLILNLAKDVVREREGKPKRGPRSKGSTAAAQES